VSAVQRIGVRDRETRTASAGSDPSPVDLMR
jgi:hypothetical protein